MKKILISVLFLIFIGIVIQIIRYNYTEREINNFYYYDLGGNKVYLKTVLNNQDKYFIYILPECGSCTDLIYNLIIKNKIKNKQLIVISAGLENFDYKTFHKNLSVTSEIIFLIDYKNTFFRDFGLGFVEEFPTVVEYLKSTNTHKKIDVKKL